jgi:hypothetical protein
MRRGRCRSRGVEGESEATAGANQMISAALADSNHGRTSRLPNPG